MKKLLKQMKEQSQLLRTAINQAQLDVDKYPEGTLRISKNNKYIRFYHMTTNNKTGKYIRKSNIDLAKALASKEYNKNFLSDANRQLNWLENNISILSKYCKSDSYHTLSPIRQKLVTPYIMPDELFISKWINTPYTPSTYKPDLKRFDTKKGDLVRSKSEAIIADILYDLGIPYKYEAPITLKNGQVKYPDFTILDIKTRSEFYFEHFGMMDVAQYRCTNLEKINLYAHNGIFLGKNLIATFETDDNPLDINGIRKMLIELFC